MRRCSCCDKAALIMGPVMVLFGISLILTVIKVGIWDVLPLIVEKGSTKHTIHLVWAIFLSANVLFNYVMGVKTDPGSHDSLIFKSLCEEARKKGLLGSAHQDPGVSGKLVPGQWTTCSHTGMPKPPRAHFDSVSKKVVLHMDHYCPWLFNTVGWANLRYYFLVQLYLVASTLYICIMTWGPIHDVSKKSFPDNPQSPSWKVNGHVVNSDIRIKIIFLFAIAFAVTNLVGAFFVWNLYLILSAQTTIETYVNKNERIKAGQNGTIYRNPYDQGCWKNWTAVMGNNSIFLHLSPTLQHPPWPPYPTLTGPLSIVDSNSNSNLNSSPNSNSTPNLPSNSNSNFNSNSNSNLKTKMLSGSVVEFRRQHVGVGIKKFEDKDLEDANDTDVTQANYNVEWVSKMLADERRGLNLVHEV
ncbi:hypothetical protein AAMO2058_001659500 [Amorphochlora amoebiformis]